MESKWAVAEEEEIEREWSEVPSVHDESQFEDFDLLACGDCRLG